MFEGTGDCSFDHSVIEEHNDVYNMIWRSDDPVDMPIKLSGNHNITKYPRGIAKSIFNDWIQHQYIHTQTALYTTVEEFIFLRSI